MTRLRVRCSIALACVCVVTTVGGVVESRTAARCDDRGLERVRVDVERVGPVPGIQMTIMRAPGRRNFITDANSEARMAVDAVDAAVRIWFRGAGFPSFNAESRTDNGTTGKQFPAWKLLGGEVSRVPATLDVIEGAARWDWKVRWKLGVVPVALRCAAAGASTAGVRVVDCEHWNEYAPGSSGVAYVLWTAERARDVVVVAAGQAPARISADTLREAAQATAATEVTTVTVKYSAARGVSVRFAVPPGFEAGTRPCAAWAWDAATGVLVAESSFRASAQEVSFTGIGTGPVDVVLQAEDAAGLTWTAIWREGDAPADRRATLQPSRVSYARSTAGLPSIALGAWPRGALCAAVRPAGVRSEVTRLWTELADDGAMVAPGEYAVELEARPGESVPPTSIACRARQGVTATVRFDGDLK